MLVTTVITPSGHWGQARRLTVPLKLIVDAQFNLLPLFLAQIPPLRKKTTPKTLLHHLAWESENQQQVWICP
ncbi:hypothetical protein AMECASPLE_032229 [Ameca splendens]|uniref:Uncharacterized protein n=1 Tax=Ameca splendens TaxID=208324 RepID=A0ABV0Z6G6_9TELE